MLKGVPENINLQEVKEKLQQLTYVSPIHHACLVVGWPASCTNLSSGAGKISRYQQIDEVRQQAIQAVEEWNFSHHTYSSNSTRKNVLYWKKNKRESPKLLLLFNALHLFEYRKCF
ncbi:hypothetical protein [Nafulsella turpanensis]|uniref:hypothetical protein n=1 Tax=Nafulsella turpanensis TaxID=1265690 RepID=UPI00035DD5B5|nr:hypothetical protein [Nafulsella turpanensis]